MLHFLLISLFIFVNDCLLATRGDQGQRIVVSQAAADALARKHQARGSRPPSEQELAGLVEPSA